MTEISLAASDEVVNQFIKFSFDQALFNLKYRDITGPIIPPKLRISIGRNLGWYEILGGIDEELLSFAQIIEKLNGIDEVGASLTDIIITRGVGLLLLEEIEGKALDIIAMIENEE